MPDNKFNNKNILPGHLIYVVSIDNSFTAVFADRHDAGNDDGTYLFGYQDPDGHVGGLNYGYNNLFDYVKISSAHLSETYHNYKLEITSSAYNVYVDDVLKYTQPRNPGTPIDSRLYLDALFLGNDGAVDYVKVFDSQHTDPQFYEEFNNPVDPVKLGSSLICPNIADCKNAFVSYFNSRMNASYTSFDDIAKLYLETTGQALNVCN